MCTTYIIISGTCIKKYIVLFIEFTTSSFMSEYIENIIA